MRLDDFIKNKLNEQEVGIGYGWTSPYRSVSGIGGMGREYISTYDKLSSTGKGIFDTIVAAVTKLGAAGVLDKENKKDEPPDIDRSNSAAEKVIEFYETKPNVINSFSARVLAPLVLLANTIKDAQPHPPVSKEDNPSLYNKYIQVGFNPTLASALPKLGDKGKMIREITDVLFSLRNFKRLFRSGEITAKFRGRGPTRKGDISERISKIDKPEEVGQTIVDAVREVEIGAV